MRFGLQETYAHTVLGRPVVTLAAIALITLSVGWFSQDFALNASADSLILERDEDLRYYRYVRAGFGSDDYLIVTYSPRKDLFDADTLRDLRALRDELVALPNVDTVTSILDVPLLNSAAVNLRDISSGIRYLGDADTNRRLARQELIESPLYQNLIISSDGLTTALRVDMRQDEEYLLLRNRRDDLREKQFSEELSRNEKNELSNLTSRFDTYSQRLIQFLQDIGNMLLMTFANITQQRWREIRETTDSVYCDPMLLMMRDLNLSIFLCRLARMGRGAAAAVSSLSQYLRGKRINIDLAIILEGDRNRFFLMRQWFRRCELVFENLETGLGRIIPSY